MNRMQVSSVGLIAIGLLISSAPAVADQFRSVYVYPATRYTFSDSARNANNAVGYQVSLGYSFSKHWAFELFSDTDQFRLLDNSKTLYTRGLGLQAIYKLYPDADLSPILLFGSGWLRTDLGAAQEDSPTARGGVGMHYQPPGTPFGLRADAVLRHEFINALSPERNNYDDVTYSLGFTYRFGLDKAYSDDITYSTFPAQYVSPTPLSVQSASVPNQAESGDKLIRTSFKGRVSTGVSTPRDGDGDGVFNPEDKCTDTPPNAVVDVDGCIIYIKKL